MPGGIAQMCVQGTGCGTAIQGPAISLTECVRCDDCERLYADTKKCPHWLILFKKKKTNKLPVSVVH